MQVSMANEIVFLPNLLNAKQLSAKGSPHSLKCQKHTPQHALQRSEAFHHSSAEELGSPDAENIWNGTANTYPPHSEKSIPAHGRSPTRSHLLRPWVAVVDPSSGDTYYWNQDSNEVQWEIPRAAMGTRVENHKRESGESEGCARAPEGLESLRSILKGSRKWRSEQPALSQKRRFPNKVRFDDRGTEYIEPEEEEEESFWVSAWNDLSESLSLSLDDASFFSFR
jgi:hypothetical protein